MNGWLSKTVLLKPADFLYWAHKAEAKEVFMEWFGRHGNNADRLVKMWGPPELLAQLEDYYIANPRPERKSKAPVQSVFGIKSRSST